MSFRVLIVDDSHAMRAFIRRTLEASGFEAGDYFEASDGIEALDLLDREWVDIILTDINMPRLNGEEFVRRLAANGLTKTLPVIVVSTDATTTRMEHLRELGVRGYLIKPFTPEALRGLVEQALEVQHAG
ncbi:MAG TPA: response regulator [Bryobacteraceae bacterium]|jgi:two-component system chemotaxis response regulator CheY|nr:response regulator [Bryobacteraceae bacterium]